MTVGHAHSHTPVARGTRAASALLQTTDNKRQICSHYWLGERHSITLSKTSAE